MANVGVLSGQSSNQSIGISSVQTVHTGTADKTQQVVVYANATAEEAITVKVGGESTGIVEGVVANKTRVIWKGTIVGVIAITAASSGATARVWGEYSEF